MGIRDPIFFSATSPKILSFPLFFLVALIAVPSEILAQGQANSKNASLCRSLKREWDSAGLQVKRQKPSVDRIAQAGVAAERSFISLHKSYENARQSGNMKGARYLALQMDEAWAQLGDAARQASRLTSTTLQIMVNACVIWQRGLRHGCNDKPNPDCSSGLSKMREFVSFMSANADKYSKSWRTKADHNFDDPHDQFKSKIGPSVDKQDARDKKEAYV